MNREIPVRFWESGRVKIPPATHQQFFMAQMTLKNLTTRQRQAYLMRYRYGWRLGGSPRSWGSRSAVPENS